MSKKWYWMLVATFLATQMAFTVGCDEADDTDVEEQDTTVTEVEVDMLADVMATLDGYVNNSEVGPNIKAGDLYNAIFVDGDDSYQLIDVRPATQFDGAHIEGSINLPYGAGWELAETLDQLDMDKQIVLICNTGHKASFTNLYLRQLGYDSYALKSGMMGWHSSEAYNGVTETFCSPGVGPGEFGNTDNETVALETFELPEILSAGTGEELVVELAGEYWAEGNGPVIKAADVNTAVTDGDDSYQIVDIRGTEMYDGEFGHISGAIDVPYTSFFNGDALVNLDPSKKLVVVCYTGHTASQITMLLNELGYEAYSMKYGMMGWHSNFPGNGCDAVADYQVVGTLVP